MQKPEKQPLGVIDALAGGFAIVARRPWVLLIPIALDLFLWFGPQMTAAPVFQSVIAWLDVPPPAGASPDTIQDLAALKGALQTASERFNLFTFLALFAPGMPTLSGLDAPSGTWLNARAPALSIADATTFLGLFVLFAFVGLFVGSVYLEALARPVRCESGGVRAFIPRVAKSYVNVMLLIGLALIALLLFILPFAAGATLVSRGGVTAPLPATFLVFLATLLILWAGLYLAFAIPAVFVRCFFIMTASPC